MERITLFADIILPLPLPGYYTYRIPYEMNDIVKPGQRVVVQFGQKKIYTGLIRKIHENVPKGYTVKYILSILDIIPLVNEKQFKFWEWIADYYMCNPGDVMHAALPPAFKLASESKVVINPDFDGDYSQLNENENLIAEALLSRDSITDSEVSNITGLQKVIPLLKTLIEKNVVLTLEEISERYKPKIETYVSLCEEYCKEDKLQKLFDELEKKSFKQLQMLQLFLQSTGFFNEFKNELKRSELLKLPEITSVQLNALIKKGVFVLIEKEESRLKDTDAYSSAEDIVLSEQQSLAFDNIKKGFSDKPVVLLHGVTSSGKTEIYIKLINEMIKEGKQVLYLLPEIALTTQIIYRLQKYFGDQAGVYHSKYNEHERVEIWNKIIKASDEKSDHKYKVIIGARSAIFLPFDNLGLIIVDEEHDSSFKQYDPAPRYNARDAAIYLAQKHNAVTLLGSATPAVESYYNAITHKYNLVEITERYFGDVRLCNCSI